MWSECLKKVQTMSDIEIESSVGFIEESVGFSPGLDFDSFQNLYTAMNTATFWDEKIQKHILIDYIFTDNVRGRYFGGTKSPEFVQKRTLKSLLFDVHQDKRGRAVRLKVSQEHPHNHMYTEPISVKLTERWSFLYVDKQKVSWRYDLNKTVTGKNKEDACQMQPAFTVEIEVSSPEVCADIFKERTLDLLGRFDKHGGLLALQPTLGKLVKVYTSSSF
jgi:hypothetical protein